MSAIPTDPAVPAEELRGAALVGDLVILTKMRALAEFAFAFPWHRDAWYSAPAQQINWWIPIFPVPTAPARRSATSSASRTRAGSTGDGRVALRRAADRRNARLWLAGARLHRYQFGLTRRGLWTGHFLAMCAECQPASPPRRRNVSDLNQGIGLQRLESGVDVTGSTPVSGQARSRRTIFKSAVGVAGASVLAEVAGSPARAAQQAMTVQQGALAPAVVNPIDAATITVDASLGNDLEGVSVPWTALASHVKIRKFAPPQSGPASRGGNK